MCFCMQHTSKEIKPQGWLKRQLKIQAEGLSGNLDKIWPDIKDSAWISGTAEGWLLDLARILKEQGADYNEYVDRWKRPLNQWTFETHIVNLGMMLKHEAVVSGLLDTEYTDNAEYLHGILSQYNGTPLGLFTGDECLSGLSPIQGTELCAVVEQMYSYELLYACTGDAKWAERLELLAFNALPATISDDM